MNRVEELTKELKQLNETTGECTSVHTWYIKLLTDIAMSLAVIADALKKEGDNDGHT